MKLFADQEVSNIHTLRESAQGDEEAAITEDGQISGDSKNGLNYYLTGPFIETNIVNANQRRYPLENVQTEIERFIREDIAQNRAVGECDHPTKPEVNLDKIAIKIESLELNGNQYVGKAKVLSSPHGQLIKTFIDDDLQIGVSTRALGTLKESRRNVKEVQNDFKLIAIDAVHGPSAPNSFVQGIMESKEYYIENGIIRSEELLDETRQQVEKTYGKKRSKKQREREEAKIFEMFLQKLQ